MAQHGEKKTKMGVAKHKFAVMHLMVFGGAFTHQRLGDLADEDLQAVAFNAQFLLRHAKSPDSRNA